MKLSNGKTNAVLFILLILCFAAVQVQADTSPRSLFAKSYGPLFASPTSRAHSFPANEQSEWRTVGNGAEFGNVAMTIMAGVAGNVVGMYAGAYLGFVVPPGPIYFGFAGSTVGSALGVYLAGSSCGRGGNFGAALGGSLLGELAALGLAFVLHSHEGFFMPGFLILPPLGAALAFNGSQRSRSMRAGNGLLNLAEGKLGLGVPDVRVRPSYAPGLKAKPELQFNVNILSVQL